MNPLKIKTDVTANFCQPPKSKRLKNSKVYLSLDEKVQIMNSCSDGALILYEFYLTKVGHLGYDFKDDRVARSLGWSISKVQRLRRDLTNHHYFSQHSTNVTGIGKGVFTILDPVLNQELSQKNLGSKHSPNIDSILASLRALADANQDIKSDEDVLDEDQSEYS